jgi:hypothetical protein
VGLQPTDLIRGHPRLRLNYPDLKDVDPRAKPGGGEY